MEEFDWLMSTGESTILRTGSEADLAIITKLVLLNACLINYWRCTGIYTSKIRFVETVQKVFIFTDNVSVCSENQAQFVEVSNWTRSDLYLARSVKISSQQYISERYSWKRTGKCSGHFSVSKDRILRQFKVPDLHTVN